MSPLPLLCVSISVQPYLVVLSRAVISAIHQCWHFDQCYYIPHFLCGIVTSVTLFNRFQNQHVVSGHEEWATVGPKATLRRTCCKICHMAWHGSTTCHKIDSGDWLLTWTSTKTIIDRIMGEDIYGMKNIKFYFLTQLFTDCILWNDFWKYISIVSHGLKQEITLPILKGVRKTRKTMF